MAVVGLEFQVRSGNAVSETKKLTTATQQLENAVNNASTRLRDANGRFIAAGRSAVGASNGIKQFSAATAQATRSAGLLDGALGGLSAQLATGLVFGQAIKSATDFESIISDIGKTSNASQKDLDAVAVALKDLSAPAKTNLAPTVLARGVQDLVAQGLNLSDAVGSIEALGKVATATNSELTDVTKTGFQLQSALKIRPDELKATFDALAFAGKAGAFELKDMAQFMPTIASAATSLGITGKQGAISLAAMMQMVRKDAPGAAEASTRLTDALLKMTAPDAAKNFKKFGVDIEKVLKNAVKNGVNPMDAAVKELARVTGGDPFKLSQIFGDKEAKLALMSLMKYREEYEKLKASAGGAAAAGTVQGDFEKSLETFQGQLNSLKVASEVAAISLGTALLPILAKLLEVALPIVQGITGVASAFNTLPTPVKNNAAELVKLIVQLLLVQKTITAVAGVAALLRGAMSLLAIQTGLTATAALRGNAAMYALTTGMSTATVKAAGLLGILSRLAAFGVIAIAVNIAVNGIQNLVSAMAEINKLRGRKAAGGAAAMFAGSTKEEVVRQQAIAKQVISNERKTLKELTSIGSRAIQNANIGGVLNAFGANLPTISSANERQMEANERIGSAQAVLGLDPTKFKKAQTATTDTTNTLSPGVEPQGKEKKTKNKKERESQLADIQAANGLFNAQNRIQARIFEATLRENQVEVLRLEYIQRGVELLAKSAEIQRSKDPQNEKEARLKGVQNELDASALKYAQDSVKAVQDRVKPLQDIVKATQDKLKDDKEYQRLLAEGISPELAKQYIDIDKAYKLQQEKLPLEILAAEAAILAAKARGEDVSGLERQLAGLQQAAGVSRDQARAGAEAADATRKQQEEAQKLLDIYNQIGTSLTTGVLDGITAAVEGTKSLGESASQVLKDIAKQLLRSGIMQLLSSLAGNDGVGFFSFLTGTLGKRAMGGPVSAGSSYMVGERGPELFTPKHGGNIVPNNALGGGSTSVVVNVDASGNSNVQGDQAQSRQLGIAVSAAVQAELVKQQRPGGLLAGTRR